MAHTKDKLTATAVKAARYQDCPTKLFDGGGMYLHIQQGGKYWRLKYRFAGKEKLLALGVYPEVGLKDARKGRDEARELLSRGVEPNAHRRAIRATAVLGAAETFEALAREWWESVHTKQVEPTHSSRNLRRLEMHAFPTLGRRPVADIAPRDLLETLRRVAETGKDETAHRLLSLCGKIFRYGVATDRAERDITVDLRDSLPTSSVRHHAAIVSPEEIGALLRAIDGYGGYPVARSALKLAPLVFVRPGELRQAEWKDFDLNMAEWDFAPSKGGQPLVLPLACQAIEILVEMKSLSGRGRYVFPSMRGNSRPMSENTITGALHTLGYKGLMTGHGFRAMARTVLAERLDFAPEYIEQQLGHAVRDPNGRAYNRTTYLEQQREMIQAWADYLDTLRKGIADPKV